MPRRVDELPIFIVSDLLRPWAEGGYVPLLYTQAAIEEAAETVIAQAPSHRR